MPPSTAKQGANHGLLPAWQFAWLQRLHLVKNSGALLVDAASALNGAFTPLMESCSDASLNASRVHLRPLQAAYCWETHARCSQGITHQSQLVLTQTGSRIHHLLGSSPCSTKSANASVWALVGVQTTFSTHLASSAFLLRCEKRRDSRSTTIVSRQDAAAVKQVCASLGHQHFAPCNACAVQLQRPSACLKRQQTGQQ